MWTQITLFKNEVCGKKKYIDLREFELYDLKKKIKCKH